ncbi:hypothetical protein MMC2321_01571 [Chitinophaga sp. MM2321]
MGLLHQLVRWSDSFCLAVWEKAANGFKMQLLRNIEDIITKSMNEGKNKVFFLWGKGLLRKDHLPISV